METWKDFHNVQWMNPNSICTKSTFVFLQMKNPDKVQHHFNQFIHRSLSLSPCFPVNRRLWVFSVNQLLARSQPCNIVAVRKSVLLSAAITVSSAATLLHTFCLQSRHPAPGRSPHHTHCSPVLVASTSD